MSYVGGKARGSSHILATLNDPRFDGYDYLEPFVGMGHVLRRVALSKCPVRYACRGDKRAWQRDAMCDARSKAEHVCVT